MASSTEHESWKVEERRRTFAELLGRTNCSFLEGASHPDEMVEAAKAAGLSALGVADRDGFFGIVKAHVAAKSAGLPLMVGARMTVEGLYAPLVLLAKDGAGYTRLSALITKGRMRNPKGVCAVTLEEAASCARGCFAVSQSFLRAHPRTPPTAPGETPGEWGRWGAPTGSAQGARMGDQARTEPLPPPPKDSALLEAETARLREIFAADLSIAIARHHAPGDDARVARAAEIARRVSVPLLATNEPFFHVPARRALHDVLTAIREHVTVAELGTRRLPNAEWFVKGPAEMARLFADHPEALARSVEIAGACTFTLDSLRYRYPDEWIPKGFTAMGWLRHLVGEGTRARYPRGTPEDVAKQLAHELNLIEELDFAPYFLTVWDIVAYAREKKILCQGRGSAANSAVCFVLGITSIDPVRMNLLFERFISAERGEPPDIDVDFEHERREEVIQHLYEKYGRDRAAMVANVITYRERLAVREVGKALGLAESQIDRIAQIAGERDLDWRVRADAPGPAAIGYSADDEPERERDGTGRSFRGPRPSSDLHDRAPDEDMASPFPGRARARLKASEAPDPELEMRLADAEGEGRTSRLVTTPERLLAKQGLDVGERTLRHVLALTRELLGFPRHLGIHSGGFALTQGPIHELVPTENATMPGRTIVEWDKEDLAAVGILKIDVLSLGMLTMIRKALDLLRLHEGLDLDLATIPAEDEKTYDMICAADTVGVFQIESRAQMNMLPRFQPRCFYDLVIEIALIRPGPITGGMVQPLLRRRLGKEETTYAHPLLEPILKRTYGVPVFQEQAIKLAVAAAGFTPGEAEELRRSMTHKRSRERMEALHGRLLSGMREREIPDATAEEIVSQLSGFAGYGFPESHSASFALLVYASSWLKCHHPAAFCAALLNSQPMGFYAPHTIVSDAQRHGISVLPIDITHSHWDCTLEKPGSEYKQATEGRSTERKFLGPAPAAESTAPHAVARFVSRPIQVAVDGPPPRMPPQVGKLRGGGVLAVRTGYRYVRGLSERVKERLEATAPFASFEDFVARARVPRDAVARIACADAFASVGLSRREALWMALRMPPDDEEVFGDGGHGERAGEIRFPALGPHDSMLADYDAVGFSTHAHPVSFLREDFSRRRVLDSRALAKARNKSRVKIGGMAIVRQRPPTAGNVVFVTLEDEWGFLNLVVRPEIYDAYRPLCRDALFVVCEGTVERSGRAINVQAERFEPAVPDDAPAKGAIGVPHGHPRHLVRESPVAHQASTPAPTNPRDGGVPNVKSRDFR